MNVSKPAAAATSITCRFVDPTSVTTQGCEKRESAGSSSTIAATGHGKQHEVAAVEIA